MVEITEQLTGTHVLTDLAAFARALEALPEGHSQGRFAGRSYGTTVSTSSDRRRWRFLARELGGRDLISFNFYKVADGEKLVLRPCEMSAAKVIEFVLAFEPEIPTKFKSPRGDGAARSQLGRWNEATRPRDASAPPPLMAEKAQRKPAIGEST